ncbi:MAG: hypothetical protein IJA43_07720 [Clostridia bacterium]|nr:hypothetical protein [Clostridia bacterium]
MIKKLTALICILLCLCGCSQEEKFGLEQFVSRMNEQYNTTYKTSDFMLGTNAENKKYLFCDSSEGLISLSLDSNNDIIGVSLLINESIDINKGINTFLNICCIFKGNDEKSEKKIFTDCNITDHTIKYADNNTVITVGKYKYTVVCNDYSVTFFCDRV